MTFRINGIKQKQTDATSIVLIVETDSELLVRKLLEKYTILVLSLSEYLDPPEKFGDIWAKVKRGFDGITVVSQGDSVENVCENLLDMGLDILEINSFSHPRDADDVKKILETARVTIQDRQVAQQQIIQTKKDEQKKIYNDPRLYRAKIVVERIFARMPIIIEQLKDQLSSQEIARIDSLQEDLKKLRMGNNYEKIRDLANEILLRMQDMEVSLLKLHPEQTNYQIPDSVVSDQDLQREETRLLYTQQRKALGARVSLL